MAVALESVESCLLRMDVGDLCDTPIVCPACGDHFRGTDFESQSRHNPFTLNCYHTFCRACVEATESTRTESEVPVCHVCTTPVSSIVLNQGLADFSESVYVGNGWTKDDEPEDVPARVRAQAALPLDPANAAVHAARAKAAALEASCRFSAHKLREAKAHMLCEKALFVDSLKAALSEAVDRTAEIEDKLQKNKDERFGQYEEKFEYARSALVPQIQELREAAQRGQEWINRYNEAVASGDLTSASAALDAARAEEQISNALELKSRVCTLVDMVANFDILMPMLASNLELGHVDMKKSLVSGTGIENFLTGDTDAAREHNTVAIVCRTNKHTDDPDEEHLLRNPEPGLAFVGIANADAVFTPELDYAAEVNVSLAGEAVIHVQYIVKDPKVKDITLFINIGGEPINGSPFKLHASN